LFAVLNLKEFKMTLTAITVDMIAAETLLQLQDQLVFGNLLYRDKTSDFGDVQGFAVGDSVKIRQNTAFQVDEFAGTVNRQNIVQSKRDFEIEKHYDVSTSLTSRELALDLDNFSREVIQPATVALAEKIEGYLASKVYQSASLIVQDALMSTAQKTALVRAAANQSKIPMGGRTGIVNPDLEAALLGADYFHAADIRDGQAIPALTDAVLGRVMGVNWYGSQLFDTQSITPGDGASAGTDNQAGAANQLGALVLTVDATSGTVAAGDYLQVAGMRRPVQAAAGAAPASTSIQLVDPINEIVPDNAAVTTISSGAAYTVQGMIAAPDAYAWAAPPLDLPADVSASVVTANGMSVRVVQDYDSTTKTNNISFDLLCGATAYDPRKSILLAELN